jgi:capsular exopolysaccharide synthesis family protein
MALGMFVAFLLDAMDDSLTNADQVTRVSRLPVIAKVPLFETLQGSGQKAALGWPGRRGASSNGNGRNGSGAGTGAWLLEDPTSPAAEALRGLRGTLLLGQGRRQGKTILFTSASPGDGASTLAYNSVVAFAVQGRRVLLIDSNMRRTGSTQSAADRVAPGLAQYLAGHASFMEVVRPLRHISGLYTLSSGTPEPLSTELLGSKRFCDLLEQASDEFDVVVIDGSPLLVSTDAAVISPLVDCTLVVVRARRTTGATLARALAHHHGLRQGHVRIVLNGVDSPAEDFAYGEADDLIAVQS